jgi:hypothetical protein
MGIRYTDIKISVADFLLGGGRHCDKIQIKAEGAKLTEKWAASLENNERFIGLKSCYY